MQVASGIHPFDVPTGSNEELTLYVGLPTSCILAASSGVGSLHFHGTVNLRFASNLLCLVINEYAGDNSISRIAIIKFFIFPEKTIQGKWERLGFGVMRCNRD